MKKRILAIALFLVVAAGAVAAAIAAGNAGSSSDPLLSLSYLNGTVKNEIVNQAQSEIDAALTPVYESARDTLLANSGTTDDSGFSFAGTYRQMRLKQEDAVTGTLGTSFVLLAGEAQVLCPSGGVVDVTTGTETASGTALTVDHRYLIADQVTALFQVTGDTAVVQFEGSYTLSYSKKTDYNALTDALFAMGLFKGDGSGLGSGYALERNANRLEGLIMFIRLLGEESDALVYTGSHPFRDVPNWAAPYVAYAYAQGYTKGTGATTFGTEDVLTVQHYVTFLMRALNYREETDFSWLTAMDDALSLGVLTQGESDLFSQDFSRARVAYLSYVTLSARLSGSTTTLLERLISQGAVSRTTATTAMGKVSLTRF